MIESFGVNFREIFVQAKFNETFTYNAPAAVVVAVSLASLTLPLPAAAALPTCEFGFDITSVAFTFVRSYCRITLEQSDGKRRKRVMQNTSVASVVQNG